VDVTAEMMQVTMLVIGQRILSQDLSPDVARLNELLSACLTHVVHRGALPFDASKYVSTPSRRRFQRDVSELDDILDKYLDKRLREPRTDDLLSLLEPHCDRKQLRDHVVGFFAAGHETTAVSLAWTLYLLASHPAIQAQVAAESATVTDGAPAWEQAKQLKLSQRVIDESMRLYPPIPVVGRESLGDDSVGGFPIPKGSTLVLFLYGTHRRRDLWDRPEDFNPDRFLEAERAKQTPFSFLPFAAGPRVCVGAQFALMELRIALAKLTRSFHFDRVPGEEILPVPLVTLRPHAPIRLKVTQRAN
jgi:cytochrome P450